MALLSATGYAKRFVWQWLNTPCRFPTEAYLQGGVIQDMRFGAVLFRLVGFPITCKNVWTFFLLYTYLQGGGAKMHDWGDFVEKWRFFDEK